MTQAISPKGLALVREFEGFCAEPAPLPGGSWVVGYGHVRVGEAGADVSEAEAAHLLALDLAPYERLVNSTVTKPLSQSQFDALVSFALSVGADAFVKSQVVRRVNAGDFVSAACAMDAWRKCVVKGEAEVIEALVVRRAAEKALFLEGLPHDVAPSALMRAKLDHAASVLGAPIKYAPAPKAAPRKRTRKPSVKPDNVVLLTQILRSEPATNAVLSSPVVAFEEDADAVEITTAHAKPVARPLDRAREAVRRSQAEQQLSRVLRLPLPWLRRGELTIDLSKGAGNISLLALLLFGLGLMLLGGSMLAGAHAEATRAPSAVTSTISEAHDLTG